MVPEEWRPIEGWDYEVSSHGRVRKVGGDPLQPRKHSNGYRRVSLCREGEQKDAYIHRLVCVAFFGPAPDPSWHADHIDSDRAHNHVTNLRWLSPTENRARRRIARGERSGVSKLTEVQVREILARATSPRLDRTIAADFGMSREQIRDIRLRKLWRHVNV